MKRLLSNVLNPVLIVRAGMVQALLLVSSLCYAQEWVARYNGPGNGIDDAYAIAVDDSGNVYVTGRSMGSGTDYDCATIKYNSLGDTVWVRRYNGPVDSSDYAYAIAVDRNGNVYVAGFSRGSGTKDDYVTIKYNSLGDTAWVRIYDGPINDFDKAFAIVVDDSGNVYVTGESWGTSYDCATIKYNSAGDTAWVRRYNGPHNGEDYARAIAVDGDGNVYVTGKSCAGGLACDYLTIKYNSAGDTVWVRTYNGPGDYYDEAYAIAVDGDGNVYVTGRSWGSGTAADYATIKYNSAGDTVWVRRYNGPGNDDDYANGIAVDGNGNVYVTGYSKGSGTAADCATIKYNSAGDTAWVRRYNGPSSSADWAEAIAVDGSGNVCVTGRSWGTSYDYLTIKYNSVGDTVWVRTYDGPIHSFDYAIAIAVDGSGNVYVTGGITVSGVFSDYATIKYCDPTGVEERDSTPWAQNDRLAVHPNPCFGSAVIGYHLPVACWVELAVYDVSGRLVRTLSEKRVADGSHTAVWDGRDTEGNSVPPGIYFARLATDRYQAIKKLILIR